MSDAIVPVQGEGKRNGHTMEDIPNGFITWEEHHEAHAAYHKRYPHQSSEDIANRGGFGYNELKEYLGHPPKSWVAREPVRFKDFKFYEEPVFEDEVPAYDTGSSHIWEGTGREAICVSADAAPDVAFFFDVVEAPACPNCLTIMNEWLANWQKNV